MTTEELGIIIRHLRHYPKYGGLWGYGPLQQVTELEAALEQVNNDPGLLVYVDPAIYLAIARGEFTQDGVTRSMSDLITTYYHLTGKEFGKEVQNDPASVAEELRNVGRVREADIEASGP